MRKNGSFESAQASMPSESRVLVMTALVEALLLRGAAVECSETEAPCFWTCFCVFPGPMLSLCFLDPAKRA